MRRRKRPLRRAHLRRGRLQIGAGFLRLPQRIVEWQRRSRRERNVVADLVLIGRRQADHPRQIDLLLREIVLQRGEPLLLRERLHLAAADIDLRDEPDVATLLGLLVAARWRSPVARVPAATRARAATTCR